MCRSIGDDSRLAQLCRPRVAPLHDSLPYGDGAPERLSEGIGRARRERTDAIVSSLAVFCPRSLFLGFRKHSPRGCASSRCRHRSQGPQSGCVGAKLEAPVEVSEPIRANPVSSSPWLICLRSGKSEQSKRLTYSAFFKKDYVSSRWSAFVDNCGEQVYHPFKGAS